MKEKKLVFGVGINDADYLVKIQKTVGYRENAKPIQKLIWACPFYVRWHSMLRRCFSKDQSDRFPSYKDCSVYREWHLFSNFKAWMGTKDWEGKVLDKDILFPGNKVYTPDACIFIDTKLNNFVLEGTKNVAGHPTGVTFLKTHDKYKAQCCDVTTGKNKSLGLFDTPQEAHQAWLTFKLEQAKILASQQTDPRVAAALIDRY